jgi:hypothetical protein
MFTKHGDNCKFHTFNYDIIIIESDEITGNNFNKERCANRFYCCEFE